MTRETNPVVEITEGEQPPVVEIKDKDIEAMTAGQRNCYIAIAECLDRYSLDDVLVALREHVAGIDRSCRHPLDRLTCHNVMAELDDMRERMAGMVALAVAENPQKNP